MYLCLHLVEKRKVFSSYKDERGSFRMWMVCGLFACTVTPSPNVPLEGPVDLNTELRNILHRGNINTHYFYLKSLNWTSNEVKTLNQGTCNEVAL
jgi:hypothetical protein